MNEVTRIINAIQDGDKHATEELLPLVYEELRLLAAQKMAQEKPGQTLQATALVHEAYLKLLGADDHGWDSKGHFFAAAAEAMRRILVDNARRKKSLKSSGSHRRIDWEAVNQSSDNAIPIEDIIALDEALESLSAEDSMKAELIKLRFFAGLTIDQAAKVMGISPMTAKRDWAYARAWLLRVMS